MYYYAYLCYFMMDSMEYKQEQVCVWSSVWAEEHICCFCVGLIRYVVHNTNLCVLPRLIKHSLVIGVVHSFEIDTEF